MNRGQVLRRRCSSTSSARRNSLELARAVFLIKCALQRNAAFHQTRRDEQIALVESLPAAIFVPLALSRVRPYLRLKPIRLERFLEFTIEHQVHYTVIKGLLQMLDEVGMRSLLPGITKLSKASTLTFSGVGTACGIQALSSVSRAIDPAVLVALGKAFAAQHPQAVTSGDARVILRFDQLPVKDARSQSHGAELIGITFTDGRSEFSVSSETYFPLALVWKGAEDFNLLKVHLAPAEEALPQFLAIGFRPLVAGDMKALRELVSRLGLKKMKKFVEAAMTAQHRAENDRVASRDEAVTGEATRAGVVLDTESAEAERGQGSGGAMERDVEMDSAGEQETDEDLGDGTGARGAPKALRM